MKYLKFFLILLLCSALITPAFAQESPQKRLYLISQGKPDKEILRIAELAAREFAACGYDLSVAYGTKDFANPGDVLLVQDSALPSEGYRITTGENLCYADADGLLHGLRRLLKMQLCGKVTSVSDAPDTKERTLMLDCARKYFTKDFICNLIRQMSWMGMNTLELHLSEEQGIRADIWDERYFQSENDYSWICGSKEAYWVYDCPDPDAGKYLTAAELLEIIAVAQQYRIKIIPSLDTPGHSEYLCNVFAEHVRKNPGYTFTFQGKTYQTATIASNQYSVIDIASEAACAFMRSVILDYAKFFALYGSTDFNICADEISLDSTWASGDKTAYDAFAEYLNETAQLLQDMGYTVRAFNDFLCYSGSNVALNPEIEIVYWHTPRPSEAADASVFIESGRTVYNAIQNYCYYALRVFNAPGYEDRTSWGLDARDENNLWWSFSRATAERVYAEWNPTHLYEYKDSQKTVLQNEQLGGSYFLIWCDYAGHATEEEIWSGEYPLLERLWAHSAKAWNWNAESYEAFVSEIQHYYEYPGLVRCNRAPVLPTVSDAVYADRLLSVQAVEEFRSAPLCRRESLYRAFLQSKKLPYGAFGRKMS